MTAVIRALREPGADLGPGVEHRVLAILATEPLPRRTPTRFRPVLAWAAILAGVAISGAGLASAHRTALSPTGGETRAVELSLDPGTASGVTVVGDFNDWDPRATVLSRRGERWSATLRLRPGRYRYTFLVDGARWVADPASAPAADPDFDRPTSVLTVSQ